MQTTKKKYMHEKGKMQFRDEKLFHDWACNLHTHLFQWDFVCILPAEHGKVGELGTPLPIVAF